MSENAAPIHQAAGFYAPFEASPTVLGYEVVDKSTGRPVDDGYETLHAANGRAQQLNTFARSGNPGALARALRCQR